MPVYGNCNLSYETVVTWKRNFHTDQIPLTNDPRSERPSLTCDAATVKEGRGSVEDDKRSGRPQTSHLAENIEKVSAAVALSNYNENNCLRVQNCRELLGKIKGKIVFQWLPSHCGLWGNERADFLVKKGTGILQNFRRDLTLHSAKLEIKRIFRESFRLTASRVARDKPWSTLCKKSHGIPSSPRAAAVAKFRLLTGHDCLCAHLFRFNLVTSPICVLCDTGQDMTAAHLDECSALNDLNCIVKRYWRARCLMT
ncbi:uncharacterized protein LOC103524116 [Trichonephila clavipes]|uniref:Uncharacterized protein LOC103524116 n=1 Tax=Trichonephila clavipes TaxID=2585209 RepID=A0A8X6V483_TRICX|nr:uncharacterized protein LOC103524116 [Trichonephila clavipes]